jgi:Kef-type K+ transport system membrane component KefB
MLGSLLTLAVIEATRFQDASGSLDSLGASHMDPVVPILLALIFLTFGAALGGHLMTRLGQPAVLGELLVGVVAGNLAYFLGGPALIVLREGDLLRRIANVALQSNVDLAQAARQMLPAGAVTDRIATLLAGPNGLNYVAAYSFIDLLSRIAILVLLFLVGLETSLGEMRRVGRAALRVALIGIAAPMALGMGAMKLLHPSSQLAGDLFIGGILTATSVGITARVLRDMGQERRHEARLILGAAVLDDVLSLIVLAVVSDLAVTGTVSALGITVITLKAGGFMIGALVTGIFLAPPVIRRLAGAGIRNFKLLFGWSFAFLLAWLASEAGLAPIVGAFAAGMILNHFFDRELAGQSLQDLLAPVESLIVPLFFVWMGVQVKLESLASRDALWTGLLLTVVAILGKLMSGWGCAKGTDRVAVGIGMMPRGEVGLIFAGIGRSIGVVNDALFSAVVIVVMVTTLLAPPLLRWRMGAAAKPHTA